MSSSVSEVELGNPSAETSEGPRHGPVGQPRSNSPRQRESLKFLGVILCVAVLYFCSREVSKLVGSVRSSVAEVSMAVLLPCFSGVMVARRLVPPIWYLVPTGALMVVVLVMKLGLVFGVVTFQGLKLFDLFSCFLIRKHYSTILTPIFTEVSNNDQSLVAKPSLWWLPDVLLAALLALDAEWGHRMRANSARGQAALVLALGVSWYTEEEALLYWLSLRSGVQPLPFVAGMVAYCLFNIPDMLVRARIFAAAFEAAESSSGTEFFDGLAETDVSIVILLLVIAAPATLYVQGANIRMLMKSPRK